MAPSHPWFMLCFRGLICHVHMGQTHDSASFSHYAWPAPATKFIDMDNIHKIQLKDMFLLGRLEFVYEERLYFAEIISFTA
jgi:hypothetical protein